MSYISKEQLVERIERLLVLFPKHIHNIHCMDISHIGSDMLLELLHKKGIKTRLEGHNLKFNIEVTNTGNNYIFYDYLITRQLSKYNYIIEPSIGKGFIGASIYDADLYFWKAISEDNPYIPKLQCDLLNAFFGPEWKNYIGITFNKPIKLLLPQMQKL